MGTADTQGMSQAEIDLMTEDLDDNGLPKETDTERENARVLALDSKGLPIDESDDTTDEPPAAAAAAPAPAAAATPAPAPTEPAATPAVAATPAEPAAVVVETPAAAPAEPGFVPQYHVDVPADAAEQIATLTAEKDAAFTKLMDGDADMTAEDYQAIAKRTDAAVDAIKEQMLTARVLETANTQQAENEWRRQEQRMMAEFKGEGLDYRGKPALLAAFNTHLKVLGAAPENETKDAAWFLTEAHKLTKADIGFTKAPAPTPSPAPAPAAKPRGVDMTQIPPTLSNVPPAVDPNVAADEFAHMANLTGVDAEMAYARLTPEQQERYLD